MKKHIILDFDETLCDTRGFNAETCYQSIKKHYPHANRETIYDQQHIVRGRTLEDIYYYMLKNAASIEASETFVKNLVRESMEYQYNNLHTVPIFDGTKIFLDQITKSGKFVSLVTNRDNDTLQKILDVHDISQYFDNIISCISIERLKPDPVAFELIMEKDTKLKRNINREHYVYIGDSDVDKQFAQNAGIDYLIIDQYMNDFMLFKTITNIFVSA